MKKIIVGIGVASLLSAFFFDLGAQIFCYSGYCFFSPFIQCSEQELLDAMKDQERRESAVKEAANMFVKGYKPFTTLRRHK